MIMAHAHVATADLPREAAAPTYQAYQILHFAFVIAPLLAGLDKFAHLLTDWDKYLAPTIAAIVPAQVFMRAVGAIEVVAAIFVAVKPRIGAYVVAVWLLGIIIKLLMVGGYYDVALRDLGLLLAALALGRLAEQYDHGAMGGE
jgi:uncharacterized membrane protein YphA (DoxX/SURF4 family)